MTDAPSGPDLAEALGDALAPPGELALPAAARDEARRLAARAAPGTGLHALVAQSEEPPPRLEELVLVIDPGPGAALPAELVAAAEKLVERLARAGAPLPGGLRVATREGLVREIEALRTGPDPRVWGGPPEGRRRRYHRL